VSEGIVYVLTNGAMPGFIKIGMTQQDDLQSRLKQLYNTSTPLPFECVYAARVPDCRSLERTLHFVFGEKRVRANREFFTADPDLVRAVIELVKLSDATPTDEQQDISPAERVAIEEISRARAEPMTLEKLGLTPGAVLTFTKDPVVTCTVDGSKTVLFEGEVMSLSQAALKAIRAMGYDWPSARGFEYWAYQGVKLTALQPAQPALP
jgi:hypothetical protein